MNIQSTAAIFGTLWLIPALTALANPNFPPMQRGTVAFADNYQIEIEIADTEALRQYGLMHRASLPENQGMLFVYPDQAIRGVWMKNTLIPLDILFLSSDKQIISLLPNMRPCAQEPCPISISSAEAQYMLEVNAGFLEKHGVKLGQRLTIEESILKPK